MKLKSLFFLTTHLMAMAFGAVMSFYLLPIIIAPDAPKTEQLTEAANDYLFKARFVKNLADSDFLHWADGELFIGSESIDFMGAVSPGPDYKLYLSPTFIETESAFLKHKHRMQYVADIKTFNNFSVTLNNDINLTHYNTVIIWCETFKQFISAAQFK